jgi:Uma2 family endonuclease
MTIHPLTRVEPKLTQFADGLPRRAFTVSDVERMVEAGIIGRHERFELIGGEIVPMSPKGLRHERWKMRLNRYFARLLDMHPDMAATVEFVPETTFRLSDDTFLEPDFVFFGKTDGLEGLDGATALLALEVSDSSLAYDLGRKSAVYAAFGVAELWVLNVETRVLTVFREPAPLGYRQRVDVPSNETVEAARVPGLTVCTSAVDA